MLAKAVFDSVERARVECLGSLRMRGVAKNLGAKSETRITLTYPALDSSHDVVFLAAGDQKKSVVKRAKAGDHALPASRIEPIGALHWFIDRDAASAFSA